MSKAIVITGASKGIGRAAADLLSAQGWLVIGGEYNGRSRAVAEIGGENSEWDVIVRCRTVDGGPVPRALRWSAVSLGIN